MFFNHQHLTTAIHSRLRGDLADQWLNAAAQVNVQDLAEELLFVEPDYRRSLFSELDDTTRLQLLAVLPKAEAVELVEGLRASAQSTLLKRLPLGDLARLIGMMSFNTRNRALQYLNLHKQKRLQLQRLLQHKRFDFTRVVNSVQIGTSVNDALDYYFSDQHVNYAIYVTDESNTLCGVLSGHLLTGITVRSAPVALYMEPPAALIVPDHDYEYVKHQFRDSKALELPVVDQTRQLIGVVDVDNM